MSHQSILQIIQVENRSRLECLLIEMDVEKITDLVLHKKKGGPLLTPTSYQAMMSVIAAKEAAWRMPMSTVARARISTEPAL